MHVVIQKPFFFFGSVQSAVYFFFPSCNVDTYNDILFCFFVLVKSIENVVYGFNNKQEKPMLVSSYVGN